MVGNERQPSDQSDELGSRIKKQNRQITLAAGAGVALAIVVALVSYQMGKSDAGQDAEQKGYAEGVEKGIYQGLKAVEDGQVSVIEENFAQILRDAEQAAELRGFERGFAEGEQAGIEKGKDLGRQEAD